MNKNKLSFLLGVLLSLSVVAVTAEDGAEAKRTGEEVAQACIACHGEKGVSRTDMYPHLAGQYASYLARALRDYRDGRRDNQVMKSIVDTLSDHDIKVVSEYYASQSGLIVPSRRSE